MLSLFRRVRDTFRAGKAEQEFRELSSQMRLLIGELEHSLEKDALRRATAARRLSRERAKEEETTVELVPSPAAEQPEDRKAAIRRRLATQGTLVQRIQARNAGGEE